MNVELVNPAAVLSLLARPRNAHRAARHRAFRPWTWFGGAAKAAES
jgi:hypothetical protein